MPISLSDFSFKKLDISKPVDFDCGDADLNEFFTKDAKFYQEQLLANTYYWEKNNKIAAMFSVSNDAIQLSNREKRKTHPEKPLRAYPAVKIGRLAVSTEYQKKGLGRQVLDFLKILFLIKNKTGCRYLTVDAYNKPGTTGFYEKNDFKFLTKSDIDKETRTMYFDLMPFYKRLEIDREAQRISVRIIKDYLDLCL